MGGFSDYWEDKILDYIFDLLKWIDRGAILLVNNEMGELEEIIGRSKFSSGKTIINYSRSIVDKVMKDGRPINWAAAIVIVGIWLLLVAIFILLIARVINAN